MPEEEQDLSIRARLEHGLLGPPLHGARDSGLLGRAEFKSRRGDPACGGSAKMPIMTAYRQQALACAAALASGPRRPRDLKGSIPDAPKILLSNVYGWFVRQERGLYALSEQGRAALGRWPTADLTRAEGGGERGAEPLRRDPVRAAR